MHTASRKKNQKTKLPLVPSKSLKFFLQKSLWLEGEGGDTSHS